MSKEDSIEVTGTVVEKFPSGLFSVELDLERKVLAHLAGKLRRNRIRVLAGDRVTLEMSPYDLTKGRITYRHKWRSFQHPEPPLAEFVFRRWLPAQGNTLSILCELPPIFTATLSRTFPPLETSISWEPAGTPSIRYLPASSV